MEVVAENYQLKWHSYSSYLHSYVSVALQNDSFADVALITLDGHQVMAHRFILSANSQYFHQVFKLQPKVTTTLPIMIILPSEISYKTLLILLQYMYSGEATVSNDVLENVLRGGDILKVKGLYRPKEDEQFDKKGVKVSHKTNNSIPTPKNEKKSTKSATTQNQQKVLNYTFNVKKFNNDNSVSKEESQDKSNNQIQVHKDRSKNISETRELAKKSESDKSNNEDESSKSNETMQILVIKEEPIEWTEVEGEMELVDEKEVFNAELSIKPEVYMEDSNPAPSEEMYSPLTCELCTETFTIPAEWVRHVQTHTDMLPAKRQRRDRPSKDDENATFPALHCDMCQKFFPTPAEWVHHIQDTHTEFELHLSNKKVPKEVPQTDNTKQVRQMSDVHKICSDCNKVFPSHASMLIHKRTHTGEKPYSCEFCYKGFNVKSNLLRHLRTLHNKIINPTDVEDSTGE